LFSRSAGSAAPVGALFDVIVISAEEGVRKPDARIFERTLARLGVAPDEAVFVDDFPVNVAGARAAGLHALQFTGTPETIAGWPRWRARVDAARAVVQSAVHK
jgi:putative hydrolase of the HAD superfamily